MPLVDSQMSAYVDKRNSIEIIFKYASEISLHSWAFVNDVTRVLTFLTPPHTIFILLCST